MENQNEFDDEFIREVINKGQRDMPSSNFEYRTMARIHKELNYKEKVAGKLRLSLIYFIIAITLGVSLLLIALFWDDLQDVFILRTRVFSYSLFWE